MNEYINLTLENIEKEHICCAIGDPKQKPKHIDINPKAIDIFKIQNGE